MEAHNAAVVAISTRVKHFFERKEPFRIYHGSTNSTRPAQYRKDNIVDTSGLTHVLKVDTNSRAVLAEPNVPMDVLVAETLKHGLVPPVVMEFPGITAGGGFSGTSGESSSFRYGFFDRTVNWIEVVLANGEKTTASKDENSDLFWGTASSFGTLGVITLLEIQLVDAKKYVELRYYRFPNMSGALAQIIECTKDHSIEYLDGIVLKKDWFIVCAGNLTDEIPTGAKVRRFLRARDQWFYLHAKKKTIKFANPAVEVTPLEDYLFRYDRGAFWMGRYAFRYFLAPNDRFSRFLLDKYLRTRKLYHVLHESGLAQENIVQDVAVPYEACEEFATWLDHNFGHYPLWLCPLSQRGKLASSPKGLLAEKSEQNLPDVLMNFGVWGPGPINRKKFVEANRRLEQKVQDLGGRKWLYAHAYYTEDEFWSIFNKEEYDSLRLKYHATHLPSIWEKVRIDPDKRPRDIPYRWLRCWPLRGYYGFYKALAGKDYLLERDKHSKSRSDCN